MPSSSRMSAKSFSSIGEFPSAVGESSKKENMAFKYGSDNWPRVDTTMSRHRFPVPVPGFPAVNPDSAMATMHNDGSMLAELDVFDESAPPPRCKMERAL